MDGGELQLEMICTQLCEVMMGLKKINKFLKEHCSELQNLHFENTLY